MAFLFVAPNIEKRCHGNTNQRQFRKKQKGDSGEVLMHGKQNLEYNNIYTEVNYNKLCLPLNQKILNAVSKQTSAQGHKPEISRTLLADINTTNQQKSVARHVDQEFDRWGLMD